MKNHQNYLNFVLFIYRVKILSHLKAFISTTVNTMDDKKPIIKNLTMGETLKIFNDVLANESQVVRDVWSLYEQQCAYREIAEILNLDLNIVVCHIKKIKNKLKIVLKERELNFE